MLHTDEGAAVITTTAGVDAIGGARFALAEALPTLSPEEPNPHLVPLQAAAVTDDA